MITKEQDDVLQKALDTYGIKNQTLMLAEECAELVQAASKLVRNTEPIQDLSNIKEEMADVLIMIYQMQDYYNIKDSEIQFWIDYKINRLNVRLTAAEE